MAGGGGGAVDSVMYTNMLPTYIPGVEDWTVGYLKLAATAVESQHFSAYPGATYAAQTADETAGIAAIAFRGSFGSDIEISAEAYLQNLLGGNYLANNPNLVALFQARIDELYEQFTEETLPNIQERYRFAFGGSEHNIAEAEAAKKIMAKIAALAEEIFYDDYRKERRLQDSGISHAVPYGQRGIRDAEMLRSAGVYQREYDQGLKIDNWKKFNEDVLLPIRNLNVYGNAVRTILGTGRTTDTKYYKPPAMAEIAGLALTGAGIYSLFKDTTRNPYSGKQQSDITTGFTMLGMAQKMQSNQQLPMLDIAKMLGDNK